MKKIILLISITFCSLIILSEVPIREKYLIYTLSDTQYEKLLWLHLNLEKKIIKDQKFNIILFGSSSSLYGFNDSITELKSLNLGVNTGHRELDLFLLEKFLENKNSANHILREFHSLDPNHMNYYGLHPVIHLFVNPSWLIKNGQNILQPHFLKYLSDRIRAVFQSYLFFHLEKPYDLNYTDFGYRPKLTGIPREDFNNTIPLEEVSPEVSNSKFSMLHHNFVATNKFREKFDKLAMSQTGSKLYYLHFPYLVENPQSLTQLDKRIYDIESKFNIKVLRIHDDL